MADLTVKQVLQKLGKDILNWVKTNCVDNLVSTSKNLPLSANQGRVLKEGQDAINQSLDEKFTIIAVNETIDNISIGANGTVQVNFTKFKSVKGYTRIIVNTSFWNATTNGGGYSNAFVYSMLYASSGVGIQMKNIANAGIRVKLSVTCLYFNSYIESSVIPTPRS